MHAGERLLHHHEPSTNLVILVAVAEEELAVALEVRDVQRRQQAHRHCSLRYPWRIQIQPQGRLGQLSQLQMLQVQLMMQRRCHDLRHYRKS